MSDITIRPLVVKDRVVLTAMVRKLADKLGGTNLLSFITPAGGAVKPGKDEGANFAEIGLRVLKMLLETLEEDVRRWFASLVNKTPEEFDELPFNTELEIIEQLMGSKEANDFFTGALRLYKRTQGSAEQLLSKKKV